MNSSLRAIALLVLLLLFPGGSRSAQQIFTPDTGTQTEYVDLGLDVSNSTSIKFQVQACNDAHVLLMETPGDEVNNIIENVIGGWGNTKSIIRTVKQGPAEATTYNTPLNCNEPKPFWVSWADGIYTVGDGLNVGIDEFMSYDSQSTPVVNAVAISTGWGSPGMWLFDHLTCAAGETVTYAYCKSDGDLEESVVGLGDVKVTKVWSNIIVSGDCRREHFGFNNDTNIVWVNNGCGLIMGVCLVKEGVASQLQTTVCNTPQEDCPFINPPTNGTLISVSEVTPGGVCSSLGFMEPPYGFTTNAPDVFGYTSNSMFVNGNCAGTFQGCFSDHNCLGGEIKAVKCTSPNGPFGYKACRVDDGDKVIRYAWLVTPSSPTQCNYFNGFYPNQGPGGAWGYYENILWTAEGCGATFGVCLEFGCPGGQMALLNCSSVGAGDDKYQECTLPDVTDYIILYSMLFDSAPWITCLNEGLGAYDPAIHTSSLGMYGWKYDKLWLKNICAGLFRVCYKDPCKIHGDPHFLTEDGKKFNYSGHCTYQLVSDDLVEFYIDGNFFKCGHGNQASCLSSLNIIYGGLVIELERPRKIKVEGNLIPIPSLPHTTPNGQVHIKAVGGWIRVELSNGVYIMWDGKKKADIYIPITFQGITMGLCGTYDINIHNDFTLRNGTVVDDKRIFGDDWEISC